jgi:hypothetical protein
MLLTLVVQWFEQSYLKTLGSEKSFADLLFEVEGCGEGGSLEPKSIIVLEEGGRGK